MTEISNSNLLYKAGRKHIPGVISILTLKIRKCLIPDNLAMIFWWIFFDDGFFSNQFSRHFTRNYSTSSIYCQFVIHFIKQFWKSWRNIFVLESEYYEICCLWTWSKWKFRALRTNEWCILRIRCRRLLWYSARKIFHTNDQH